MKGQIQISVNIKAYPGRKVMVANYRSKYKPWEEGIVKDVTIKVNAPGKCWVSYDVLLTRESAKGNVIWLYVDESQITLL